MRNKDNFQISISINEEIAEVVITGEVIRDTVERLHEEVLRLLKDEDFKALLIDLRAVRPQDADTIAGAYFRARSLPQNIMQVPSAVVNPNENATYISFYETTAANVGQLLKWFTEIEVARTWLRSRV